MFIDARIELLRDRISILKTGINLPHGSKFPIRSSTKVLIFLGVSVSNRFRLHLNDLNRRDAEDAEEEKK